MKAILTAINSSLEFSSEKSLVDNILLSVPDSKFLIKTGGVPLAQAEVYDIVTLSGVETPIEVLPLNASRVGSTFRVFLPNGDNLSTAALRSRVSFSGLGDVIETLMNGEYVAAPLTVSIPGDTVRSFEFVWIQGEAGGMYTNTGAGDLQVYDESEIWMGATSIATEGDADALLSDLLEMTGVGEWVFLESNNLAFFPPENGMIDYFFEDTVDLQRVFATTVAGAPTSETVEATGIVLDQIGRTLSLVNAEATESGGPLTASLIASIERSVEAGSYFE